MSFKKANIVEDHRVSFRCSICEHEDIDELTCDFCGEALEGGKFKCDHAEHICNECFKKKRHLE